MSAVTVTEIVEAIVSDEGEPHILRCLEDLQHDEGKISRSDHPQLHEVVARLGGTSGAIVVACVHAFNAEGQSLGAVHRYAEWPAPKTSADADAVRRRAAALYADCFLVMAEFVATWNRSQIGVVS